MSASPRNSVARHVHELVERQRLDVVSDDVLLSQFSVTRDDAVFAALVRRHGPMVLGVCQRILRHTQDAEDACQATFLVLARKGRMVRRGESLPGWLHRVAVRAASRFRRERSRRATESLPAGLEFPASASDEMARREIWHTFDAEIGRLPSRFRLPLVLCCLQGKSRSEAADELGWSEGTVRGRLERGRKLLRSRFTRKGLTLPAGLLLLLREQSAPATAPTTIIAPSSAAQRLADGVLRSMAVARIKLATFATAAVLLLGTAAGLGLYSPAAAQPKPDEAPLAISTPAAADAEKNLDTFIIRIALAPAGRGQLEPRFSLYQVLLYVPNLRLEPPVKGLDGKPSELHARISKEQARKIMDALGRFDFFKDDSARQDPWTRKLWTLQPALAAKWPHVGLAVRFQNGEDASQVERLLAWLPQMLPPLDAIRGCVDGDAGKSLDELLKQLADDRNKWAPDPFAADLKKLQGSWIAENRDTILRVPVVTNLMSKCTIEGKKIVLKPVVQRNPLFDLETIRGEFELTPGKPGTMTIKGIRDTVSKQESDAWTCHYEVTDSTLKILLPQAGTMPSAGMQPNIGKGERAFEFKRALAGQTFDWGESSNGVQLRLRSPNNTYLAGEVPTFDLDVRSEHPRIAGKPWDWLAPRVESFARVEVDGVWYRAGDLDLDKVVSRILDLGQTIDGWVKVRLMDDFWVEEKAGNSNPQRLVMKPGKHKVRIGYGFRASEGSQSADPVSGAIDIIVQPPGPKDDAVESKWGEASDGIRARIRTPKSRYRTGEDIDVYFDAKAESAKFGGSRSWHAGKGGHYARVEVDGVWHVYKYTTWEFPTRHELKSDQEISPWTIVKLNENWVAEGVSPLRELKLAPGKHSIRVEYAFQSDATKPPSARPVGGPIEIEVVPGSGSGVGHESNWGEDVIGVSARIRAPRVIGIASDDVAIELDVRIDKSPISAWTAGRDESLARVELDGIWYASQERARDAIARQTLRTGDAARPWVTIQLGSHWVAEKSRDDRSPAAMNLTPGKHTLRMAFEFQAASTAKDVTAEPMSGPLEIEIAPL